MVLKSSLVLGLVAVALLGTGVPALAATGEVTGTVTRLNGPVIVGVPVKAYTSVSDPSQDQTLVDETVTDAQGRYTLHSDLTQVIVCFESPEFVHECWQDVPQDEGDSASYGTPVNPQFPGGATGIDAALIVGGAISGKVIVNDGSLAEDPEVTVTSDTAFFHAEAADNGTFSFMHLPPGTYRLCARATNLLQMCTEDLEVVDFGHLFNQYVNLDGGISNFAATEGGVDRVRWSWNPVLGATRYRIALSTSPSMVRSRIRYVDGRFATFTGLTPGKTYYASVRALNVSQQTAASPVFPARPGRVVGLRLWNASDKDLIIRSATWTNATKYQYRLSSLPTFAGYRTLTAREPLVQFFSLNPGTTYYVQVRALGRTGMPLTAWSGTVPAATWS